MKKYIFLCVLLISCTSAQAKVIILGSHGGADAYNLMDLFSEDGDGSNFDPFERYKGKSSSDVLSIENSNTGGGAVSAAPIKLRDKISEAVVARLSQETSDTADIVEWFEDNYVSGDTIYLIGYSAGGKFVVNLAEKLAAYDISAIFLIDPYVDNGSRTIPSNVDRFAVYYQHNWRELIESSGLVGFGSYELSTDTSYFPKHPRRLCNVNHMSIDGKAYLLNDIIAKMESLLVNEIHTGYIGASSCYRSVSEWFGDGFDWLRDGMYDLIGTPSVYASVSDGVAYSQTVADSLEIDLIQHIEIDLVEIEFLNNPGVLYSISAVDNRDTDKTHECDTDISFRIKDQYGVRRDQGLRTIEKGSVLDLQHHFDNDDGDYDVADCLEQDARDHKSFDVEMYSRIDGVTGFEPVIDGNHELGEIRKKVKVSELEKGDTEVVHTQYVVVADEDSEITFQAKFDTDDEVDFEEDQTREKTFAVIPEPTFDIVLSSLDWYGETTIGFTGAFWYKVRNDGDSATRRPFTILHLSDGHEFDRYTVDAGLGPGEEIDVPMYMNPTIAGFEKKQACYQGGDFPEIRDDNNCTNEGTLKVLAPTPPDIVLSGLDYYGEVTIPHTGYFSYTIKNEGGTASPEIGIVHKSDRTQFEVIRTGPLQPGESRELTMTMTPKIAGLEKKVACYEGGDFQEDNTWNNCTNEGQLKVHGAPEVVAAGPADIKLSGLDWYGETEVGHTGYFHYTVTNQGETASTEIGIVHRSDGDQFEVVRTSPLQPGESRTLTMTMNPTVAGMEKKQACYEGGDFPEDVTWNNCTNEGTLKVLGPNYDVHVHSLTGGNTVEDDTWTLQFKVKSEGDALPADIALRVMLGSVRLPNITIAQSDMTAGAEKTYFVSGIAPGAGNHTLDVRFEGSAAFQESNMSNNISSSTLTVAEKPKADIVLSGLNDSGQVTIGYTGLFHYTVKNVGTVASTRIGIIHKSDGSPFEVIYTDPLAPGQSRTLTMTMNPTVAGVEKKQACYEGGDFPELRSDNNCTNEGTLTVVGKNYNVKVHSLTGGTTTEGDTWRLQFKVKNAGESLPADIALRVKLGSVRLANVTIPKLHMTKGAAERTYYVSGTAPGAGSLTLDVRFEGGTAFSESNVSDNIATSTLTVNPKPRADITLYGLNSSGQTTVGYTGTFHYTVKNIGTAASTRIGIVHKSDGTQFQVVYTDPLQPGQSRVIAMTMSPAATGLERKQACYEGGDFPELRIDNNCTNIGNLTVVNP